MLDTLVKYTFVSANVHIVKSVPERYNSRTLLFYLWNSNTEAVHKSLSSVRYKLREYKMIPVNLYRV